jgi:hypothetical protein
MEFKLWLENIEATRTGIKDTILKFLKPKLKIRDDSAILSMSLGSMDASVVSDLVNRGLVSGAGDDTLSAIRNGTITVSDLIDRISGFSTPKLALPAPDSHLHKSVV